MDADTAALQALASQARGYFRWAIFLLLVMAGILVIDLQLKRSVARQAVAASAMLGKAVAHGKQPAADVAATDHDHGKPDCGCADAVDGSARVAETADPPDRKGRTRRGSVAERPGDDGPGD